MGKEIQTPTGGLRRQGKGGGETSTCLFLQWALFFFSPGHCQPHYTTESALRKFGFLLNKVQTLWIVLVRFFISLLGQRYTMFRD